MYNHFLKILLVCFLFGLISGCKKESILPVSPSLNYFPVQKGKWIEYSVDSIVHADNDNNNDDSVYYFNYFVREVIDSSYIDGAGRTAQVILRYKRFDMQSPWTLSKVWTQVLSDVGAFRTEDNYTFEKLGFPINRKTTWNGNNMNVLDEEFYVYKNIHTSFTMNNQTFDSTLNVIQIDENNYIERRYGIETYATGIGVIYKERDDLEKRLGIVVKGVEFKMQMIQYGE